LNKEIYKFYKIALLDLEEGVSLEELELYLKMYEEEENYEACAGILKAINETKYDTIQNIKERKNDIR
jgi:DNA-binding transcriptional MerR regulator